MRVFVTGATGWVGSAVVPELVAHGHEVVGLARADEGAARLQAAGATPLRSSLEELGTLKEAAAAADAVVHLAFRHDLMFSGDVQGATAVELEVVAALGDALAGSGKPLVITTGLAIEGAGPLLTEADRAGSDGAHPRAQAETLALGLAEREVKGTVVRLPPTVHGEGDHGFVAMLSQNARDQGAAYYVEDGATRWAATHRSDVARLYRLAVEQAPGGVLHAVAEEGVPSKQIAEALGRGLDLPAASVPREQAMDKLTWLGGFFGLDMAASAQRTREQLGWEPTGPTLLEDLDAGHYTRT